MRQFKLCFGIFRAAIARKRLVSSGHGTGFVKPAAAPERLGAATKKEKL
jgi:hypothetical protein